MMLRKLCFRKPSILNLSALFLRESSDLKGGINLLGAPMSPAFLYARGARPGSVEGPDLWNQVLDNALREPAGRESASCSTRTTVKPRSGVVH